MELKFTELRNFINVSDIKKASDDANGEPTLIGQPRATDALRFALRSQSPRHNLIISGYSGCGRSSFAERICAYYAAKKEPPNDIVYAYNFENPNEPQVLVLPPGRGIELKNKMSELLVKLERVLPLAYRLSGFETRRAELFMRLKNFNDRLSQDMLVLAERFNFVYSPQSQNGFAVFDTPIIDGKQLSAEDFVKLPAYEKDVIDSKAVFLQGQMAFTMTRLKVREQQTRKQIKNLEYTIGLFAIGAAINEIAKDFLEEPDVLEYLKAVKESLLENLQAYLDEIPDEEFQSEHDSQMRKKRTDDEIKYEINVLISSEKAPVIVEHNPTYTSFVGEVEFDGEFNGGGSNLTKIRPGTLHKANGGYLILKARDLLKNNSLWEALRRAILTEKINIEPARDFPQGAPPNIIRPQPAPFSAKIVLIGSPWQFDALSIMDDQFEKLFSVCAPFDYEIRTKDENLARLASFIKNYVKNKIKMSVVQEAVKVFIEFSMREAQSKRYFSADFGVLCETIEEAAYIAQSENSKKLREEHAQKALRAREYRRSLYEEKNSDYIISDIINIETQGTRVGQINGLAMMGNFAKPVKITATTYMGKAGVISIDKEADLSGRVHVKGSNTLIGYLGHTFAKETPLTLSARIAFEQSYGGIDGDSASMAETIALISSLADVPIKQNIAITGSMNQLGYAQAIGGVTPKIEGFFDLVNERGLDGSQGVIIPRANVQDLALKSEVIEAVKNNLFRVFAIEHITEAFLPLTGIEAKKGPFSVYALAKRRLRTFYKRAQKGDSAE